MRKNSPVRLVDFSRLVKEKVVPSRERTDGGIEDDPAGGSIPVRSARGTLREENEMDSKDEFVHSYPKPLDAPWKENWYFNFIDRPNRAFPLRLLEEPLTQQGSYSPSSLATFSL